MFKKILLLLVLVLFSGTAFAQTAIRYSESILPYKGGVLIPCFGSDNMQVRADEKKGYILYHKKNKLKMFIPPDGYLKTPTAMAVYENKLYICNGDRLTVYNLKDLSETPQDIFFRPEDTTVNDMILSDDELYITVTNTNRVYKIDLKAEILEPELWLEVPSPNGIVADKNTIYVASIPADYKTVNEDNVIYVIKNKNKPKLKRFNDTPGLYDGLGFSKDGKTLYVSDWQTASVKAINLKTKEEKTIYHEKNIGPADITTVGNLLLIPDMLNHRIIIYNLKRDSIKIIESF